MDCRDFLEFGREIFETGTGPWLNDAAMKWYRIWCLRGRKKGERIARKIVPAPAVAEVPARFGGLLLLAVAVARCQLEQADEFLAHTCKRIRPR